MRHSAWWRLHPALRYLLLAVTACAAVGAHGQQIELTLDAIDHPMVSARQVRLKIDDLAAGQAIVRIGALRVAQRNFTDVRVDCRDYRWQGGRIECRRGEMSAAGQKAPLPVRFSYAPPTQALEVVLQPQAGERWTLGASHHAGEARAELDLENADLARIAAWVPQLVAVGARGKASGKLAWRGKAAAGKAGGSLRLVEGGFSDPTGTRAAEKIGARLDLSAEQRGESWNWRVQMDWDRGEAYWQPWYLADGGLRAEATGTADRSVVRVDSAKVRLKDVGEVRFDAQWAVDGWKLVRANFASSPLDLAAAAPLLISPLLEQAAAPKLDFGGTVSARGSFEGERVTALDLDLQHLAIGDANQRFKLADVTGPLAWRSDAPTQGTLRVGGASFGKLALGAFNIPYQAHGMRAAVSRLEIPVLDGRLLIDDIEAAREDNRWRWHFGAALEPVSMARLTQALGLPSMTGTLSTSIPHVRHDGSTISLDGALIIQVFDGYLSATDLKLIEPFGRVPRLFGTLDMRHIDLGQLTETFSFGNITGYIDGYVKDMELANWRPQRFDALVISSPGNYRKRISQRAVQNISALGGAGAAAAIQRSLLSMFEQFGYAKLGMSCILRQGVCEMGGIEEAPQGYVIVKGGGLPAITVMGYNRRVDWEELLARVKRVTESNAKPIVR